jgi:glycosyltransferase involved in cell wall biosynthesis/tetratricopeptide (TPR) repeat protein
MVIQSTEAYLSKKPNDIFMLELKARALTSLRDWKEGLIWYKKVFDIDPNYQDCSFQIARCAIYTKDWKTLNKVIPTIANFEHIAEIQNTLTKKSNSLTVKEFIESVNFKNTMTIIPKRILERWSELNIDDRVDSILEIDSFCLDKVIGGPYLGHVLYLTSLRSLSEVRNILETFANKYTPYDIAIWVSSTLEKYPDEMSYVSEWINTEINPRIMPLKTLEALCVSEYLSPTLETIVREYLEYLPYERLGEAVRLLGRKTDPRKYLTEEILENMIEAGITVDTDSISTWMVEHCLRSHKIDLIQKMFLNNPKGIAKPITNTMRNLVRNRFDKRLYELIEVIFEHKFIIEEIEMRQEIAKSLLTVYDPIIAFNFAYECIQIEPQDAICGLYLVQAAILTGSPSLILQAADITLSMKHRSTKIDYASIAIAAVREQKVSFAQNLLTINRLSSDTRSQRIRIGIPFHIENDYETTLKEIKNTQGKNLDDPSIILYEVLALNGLKKYNDALECVGAKVRDNTEKLLLQHMIYRNSKQHEEAKETLDKLMGFQNRRPLPKSFFVNDYKFQYLDSENLDKHRNQSTELPLVSIIMTVHRWNEAFPLAVNSVLKQSHTNIELIIVDDCSELSSVKKYDSLLTDDRVRRIRMEKNSGTYACRNLGLEMAVGEFVTFADSDDWNHPNRISNSIKILKENDVDLVMGRFVRVDTHGNLIFNGSKISQLCLVGVFIRMSVVEQNMLRFDHRARFSADSEFFERANVLLGKNRVHRHDGIDIFALHHENSLTGGGPNAIDWMGPGETRLRYVSGYRRAHAKSKLNREFNIEDFPMPSTDLITKYPNTLDSNLRELFLLDKSKEQTIKQEIADNEITVFMATYPGGFETVHKAVDSLLNQTLQVDRVILHVNSDQSPNNLPNDPRLEVRLSETNEADNGKFKYMREYKGYFFTVDDDICYPMDYVERMKSYVDHFNRQSIIGVHGAIFPFGPSISRWSQYKEHRRTHTFTSANASFTQVNCLGTGTVAFHSQIGIPDYDEIDTLRMVDLHIAVWAQKQSISMYSCPRDENWLTEFEIEHETRIWAQANSETQLQADMILTLNKISFWSPFNQFQFRMLNGPLSKLTQWPNRQLPPGMELSKHIEWTPLPENPKVTIYIPAYNTERYIVECVESALNQTYSNIEISIQNGGDGDNTLSMLERYY